MEEGGYTVREPSEFDLTEDGEDEYVENDREAAVNPCFVATTGGEVGGMVRASAERDGSLADTLAEGLPVKERHAGLVP